MLFMVELSHGPETCIAAKNDPGSSQGRLLSELTDIAREHDAEIVGGWSFPVGHRLWYVVEAQDAHAVSNLFFAAQTHHWNTVDINPVIDHETFRRTVLNQFDIAVLAG